MWGEMKGVVAMVAVQFMFAGMFILFKLTVDDGTNLKVLVAYRLSFATLFMLPLALIFQRFPTFFFLTFLLLSFCIFNVYNLIHLYAKSRVYKKRGSWKNTYSNHPTNLTMSFVCICNHLIRNVSLF